MPKENRIEVCLVRSLDLLISIYDFGSPARVPGEYQRAFKEANNMKGGRVVFPDRLLEYERSQDLLSWIVVFDGVYKIEIRVSEYLHTLDLSGRLSRSFLCHSESPRYLRCPTGKVMLASPYGLGSEDVLPTAMISLLPGVYQVGLEWNLVEEQKHWHFDRASEYPEGDGPDGVLYLGRVTGAREL